MLVALVSDTPLDKVFDAAAKLVEQAGKGNLALVSFLVLVIAGIAYKFFGKDASWVRIGAWLMIIACVVFLVLVLAVPSRNGSNNVATPHNTETPSNPSQQTTLTNAPKRCAGDKTLPFAPSDTGVMQVVNGQRVDLGDGGGGTRFQEWKYAWVAPATVTSVKCTTGRNEHVLAENKEGSRAECVGEINGGNDAMTMHVYWDGPCDQQ